jgi:hypothetical protein
MAVGSAEVAELLQVPRMTPVYPPLCNLCMIETDVREQSAELAKKAAKNTQWFERVLQ